MGWTKQGSHPAWGIRFFLLQSSQTDCRAHPVSYTMVPEAPYLGVKSSGREADHSSATSTQVRNKCRYTPTPPYKGGRDKSVSRAILYGLDGPGIESRWRRGLPHPSRPPWRIPRPASSTIGTESLSRGGWEGGIAAGVWRVLPTPIYGRDYRKWNYASIPHRAFKACEIYLLSFLLLYMPSLCAAWAELCLLQAFSPTTR
jgi:hypothetical protein